jgi:hypothetical protein
MVLVQRATHTFDVLAQEKRRKPGSLRGAPTPTCNFDSIIAQGAKLHFNVRHAHAQRRHRQPRHFELPFGRAGDRLRAAERVKYTH